MSKEKKSPEESLKELYQNHVDNPKKFRMCAQVLAGGILSGQINKTEEYNMLVETGFGLQYETEKLLVQLSEETILKQVAQRFLEESIVKYPTLFETGFQYKENNESVLIGMVPHDSCLREGVTSIPLETEWFDSVTQKTYKVKEKKVKFSM